MIIRMARKSAHAAQRRHVKGDSSPVLGMHTHIRNRAHRDARRAEEQCFHLPVRLFLRGAFRVARERVAGVVDGDVEVEGGCEVWVRMDVRLL